eukprot:scaffold31160_cov73-Cyclotella_meneghiniana.AAC.4
MVNRCSHVVVPISINKRLPAISSTDNPARGRRGVTCQRGHEHRIATPFYHPSINFEARYATLSTRETLSPLFKDHFQRWGTQEPPQKN